MFEYNASVIRVIDGDTMVLDIDLGFYTHVHNTVRLMGINTPETRTTDLAEKERGLKATEFVKTLCEQNNNKCRIISHGLDKYGRSLATVMFGDLNLNQTLLNEGLAVPYMV